MGNGTRASFGKRGRIDRSIAHSDVAWKREHWAVDARGAFFPANRRLGHGSFTPARKRNFGRARRV
jgi:hypothetical protein